jgi:pimeloyl-ACP methyl ester carboxylesterase
MVLHHGFRSVADVWHDVAEHYRERFHVLALDARGHGDSDWDPEHRYSIERYSADLDAFTLQLRLPPFVLVGHSMGGGVALEFTGTHPTAVARLVLEDGASAPVPTRATEPPATFGTWAEAEAHELRSLQARRLPQDVIDRELRRPFKELDGRIVWRDDMPALMADVPGVTEARAMELASALRCPTLLVQAGVNPVLSDETIAGMKERNRLIRSVTIEGATHDVHRSQRERYLAALDGFLGG